MINSIWGLSAESLEMDNGNEAAARTIQGNWDGFSCHWRLESKDTISRSRSAITFATSNYRGWSNVAAHDEGTSISHALNQGRSESLALFIQISIYNFYDFSNKAF